MNRRGHLSHKIPNVKIRPAPAASTSNFQTRRGKSRGDSPSDEVWREQYIGGDGEGDRDEDVAMEGSYRPWKDVTITLTGVDEKVALTKMVYELGGKVDSALTVNVTHIVASGYGSAKYNYAIEHRIPVMAPEWIVDAYEAWKQGENLSMEEDMESHRLLPFNGLKIAISGIENIERRKQIIHWINVSGGTYSKDLDRTCTHLVSAKITSDSKSSEKVKWALKEIQSMEISRRRGKKMDREEMKIVYEEWLWDCIGFRGRWKEELYDARKPRPVGKVRAEEVFDGSIFREEEKKAKEEEPEAPAVVKKRKREAMDSLVGELISTTTKNDAEVKQEQASKLTKHPNEDTDEAEAPLIKDGRREQEKKPSLLHISRGTAFSAAQPSTTDPTLKPSRSFSATLPLPSATSAQVRPPAEGEPSPTPKFYEGLRFSHVIQEDCKGLVEALIAHGGEFIPDEERLNGAEVDYIIVRLSSTVRPVLPKEGKIPEVVTECWVEGCCHESRMMSPDDHLVFRPLPATMPVVGAENLVVHVSGWSSGDAVYLKRLSRAIGGKLSEKMNRQTTHLVTSTLDSQKARKAPEWGVKIVSDQWLLQIGRTGVIPPESDYPVKTVSGAVAALPINRQLGSGLDSTANMSIVSEAGEPNYQPKGSLMPPRTVPADTANSGNEANSIAQRSIPISPSRALKMTPTHVDDKDGLLYISTSSSLANIPSAAGPSHVLSPPKAETERLLNSALLPAKESYESKFRRTASAPTTSDSLRQSDPNALRANSTGGPRMANGRMGSDGSGGSGSGSLGKKDMTEVLRQLAEDTPTSKTKIQRRPRQNGRLKANTTGGPSPLTRTSLSPMKFASPMPEDFMTEEIPEETIRVIHKDPAAEREKKRLLDALKRGQRADAAAATAGTSPSPNKRARTGHR